MTVSHKTAANGFRGLVIANGAGQLPRFVKAVILRPKLHALAVARIQKNMLGPGSSFTQSPARVAVLAREGSGGVSNFNDFLTCRDLLHQIASIKGEL